MKRNQIIITGAVVALIAAGVVVLWHRESTPAMTSNTSPAATTSPSTGSSVPAPTWLNYSNSGNGVGYQYPANISSDYVTTVDWPPAAQVVKSTIFTCTQAGSATAQAGKTEMRTVNGHPYCVTEVTEGAAGSVYTQYAYASKRAGGNTVILTFSLRRVQCGNYDDPQKSACTTAQANFNTDTLMDSIFQTVTLSAPQATASTTLPKACTMEAKLCPDGSYVGRTGPNCEFSPCPSH